MYNKITLIGTMAERPQEMYDPDGNRCACISLNVPPPSDAPPTYWGLVFDLRPPGCGSGWPVGDATFLVVCRVQLLIEKCLQSLHKGDVVCVEGRLVLTLLCSDEDLVPLAEILASEVILLKEAEED
jgi:single-stranded DNA-binding protein